MPMMSRCLLVILGCMLWSACDVNAPSQHVESTAAVQDTTPTKLLRNEVLLTNVDQLRLRRYGDTKSEMLTTLDENSPLLYTGERTDYEETIGGHKGPWKKVKTMDGEFEGWVFGAEHFVSNWLSLDQINVLHEQGKRIELFNNLTKREMTELTGANFDETVRGTRFSGYYLYDADGPKDLINGTVKIRVRAFDSKNKSVSFISCEMKINEGMPTTGLVCPNSEEGEF